MLNEREGIEHAQKVEPRVQVLPSWNKMDGHLNLSKSERLKKEELLFNFMLEKNIPSFFKNFVMAHILTCTEMIYLLPPSSSCVSSSSECGETSMAKGLDD